MWDRFFRQRVYIGITRSRMRWYVRKKYLTWVKTTEIPIWCARNIIPFLPGGPPESVDKRSVRTVYKLLLEKDLTLYARIGHQSKTVKY